MPIRRVTTTTPTTPATGPEPARGSSSVRRTTAPARTARAKMRDPKVKAATQSMTKLANSIKAATADGQITSAERKTLNTRIDRSEALAQSVVASQGAAAVRAVNTIERFLDTGKLVVKANEASTRVIAARDAVWREAVADANTNPFKHLGTGWKAPFQGVRTKDMRVGGRTVHVVAIDLANPKVKLETNAPRTRGRTVERIARGAEAELAINGDFFSPGQSYKPSGVAMTNGVRWPGTGPGEPMLAFRGGHAEIVQRGSGPEWMRNAVSARPQVLKDGKVVTRYAEPDKAVGNPRTAAGVSKDGRVLYLIAAGGRDSRGAGLTAAQTGRLMKSLGADDAIAMDAGGSAQMYQRGRGMVQRSSDPGGHRAVANVIMIQAQKR